jgi:adenylate cyclase
MDRALSLNPSSAMAHIWAAHIHGLGGNAAAAIAHADQALRLSPFDPFAYVVHLSLGMAAVQKGQYEDAASHFAKGVQANSSFSSLYFLRAGALALAGHLEEAKPIVRQGLDIEPGWRIRMWFAVGIAQGIADRLAEGGRLLGLPE